MRKRLFTLLVLATIVFPLSSHAASPPGLICPGTNSVRTAIGCLPFTGKETISALMSWALGVAGGVALLLLGYAGFMITTATGDPKRLKAAQELLTASASGIVLIALSVVILNFLGVNVLNLGGLGFSG